MLLNFRFRFVKIISLLFGIIIPSYFVTATTIGVDLDFISMRLFVKSNVVINFDQYQIASLSQLDEEISILEFNSIEETVESFELLRQHPDIEFVEPDFYISVTDDISSESSKAKDSFWGIEYLELDKYASYVRTQPFINEVVVAVIDTGVDGEHPIFKEKLLDSGYDFINDDQDPFDDAHNGHGTHVAGVIAQATSELNQVKILPIKALNSRGGGMILDVVKSIRYAMESNVDIINLSLGLYPYHHSELLETTINEAIESGITVIIAAGNDNLETENSCPAHLDNAIIVSAINDKGQKAYFSNYGSHIDLAAPGVGIYSAIPGGGYAYLDGTSMAAPHITAMSSLLKLTDPTLTPAEVEQRIISYTVDIGEIGKDIYFGYGVPKLSLALPPISVEQLLLDIDKIELMVGETMLIKLSYLPIYATNIKDIMWITSDETVAIIKDGEVIAIGAGTVIISAKIGEHVVTCEMTVKPIISSEEEIESPDLLEQSKDVALEKIEKVIENENSETLLPVDKAKPSEATEDSEAINSIEDENKEDSSKQLDPDDSEVKIVSQNLPETGITNYYVGIGVLSFTMGLFIVILKKIR